MSDSHESEEQEISDDQNYSLDPSYYTSTNNNNNNNSTSSDDDYVKLFIGQVSYNSLYHNYLYLNSLLNSLLSLLISHSLILFFFSFINRFLKI